MTKQQTEIFAFLAMFFLMSVFFVEQLRQKEEEKALENPPIIILSEQREDYRFRLGSAEVPQPFQRALREVIIPLLDSLARSYDCDVIEVVGHTDGAMLGGQRSNLDEHLVGAFQEGLTGSLRPGSNMDLGMMRATAVVHILQEHQRRGMLAGIHTFHPYSAGQMIQVNRRLATADVYQPDPARRRIEIRLLRSNTRTLDHGS